MILLPSIIAWIDVVGAQLGRGAQEGAHGAVTFGGHIDQAARGARPADQRPGVERDPDGLHVVLIDLAQLVVRDLAEKGRPAAEAGHAGDGVAGRPARGLDARRHVAVELLGLILVDQLHGVLHQALGGQEGVVAGGDHIDDGVADGGDVVEVGHVRVLGAADGTGAGYRTRPRGANAGRRRLTVDFRRDSRPSWRLSTEKRDERQWPPT
jgi:hypothetical protein